MIKEDILHLITDEQLLKYLIAVVLFYLFDFITGFTKAWSNRNIKSTKLRKGVEKFIIYFAFVGVGLTIDFLFGLTIVTKIFCGTICGIELVSLIENFKEWNLNIPDWIIKMFNKSATVETPSNSNFETDILNNPNIETYEDFEKYVEENTEQISLEELQELLDNKE